MAIVFLLHALIEGAAAVSNLVGLLTGGIASGMFPGATDLHGKLAAEIGSIALVSFGSLPYLLAYFIPFPKSSNIPLAAGAALYHYALVGTSVFRLLSDNLPLVGPDPAIALPGLKLEDARRILGLTAAALHILLGSMFVSFMVDATDSEAKKGGEETRPFLKAGEPEVDEE
ncbi:hypothetical protein HDU67_007052 [Dinochytrium kinnereticum]|nr:hypothetical protein HDU67_007052 [Dinochytrium kinnereticum]